VDNPAGTGAKCATLGSVDVVEVLAQHGGGATWSQLRAHVSERALARAVADERVRKLARGRYVLPTADRDRRAAAQGSAVVSHLSAAVAHGWAVKWPPAEPWLTVRRNRNLPAARRRGLHVTYRDLSPRERSRGVTGFVRTVVDCALKLPFDEALCVADSALRAGDVSREQLTAVAQSLRGPGAPHARRVLAAADGRAANPFESCLRAIALDVPGLTVAPQHLVADSGCYATVDLADRVRRLALEAEGFENHGTRAALERDCRRYTELATCGWRLLRYTWHDVMHRPTWVRWTMSALVAELDALPRPRPPREHQRAEAA
jgi:very-short-patch-repair endonuclease